MLALSLCNIFLEPGRIREMQLAYFAISQGFDCVHHETLIGKLRHYGVTGRALDLLKSYLSNRVQRVDVNVYINDLPSLVKDAHEIVLFADDTSLLFKVKRQQPTYDDVNNAISKGFADLLKNEAFVGSLSCGLAARHILLSSNLVEFSEKLRSGTYAVLIFDSHHGHTLDIDFDPAFFFDPSPVLNVDSGPVLDSHTDSVLDSDSGPAFDSAAIQSSDLIHSNRNFEWQPGNVFFSKNNVEIIKAVMWSIRSMPNRFQFSTNHAEAVTLTFSWSRPSVVKLRRTAPLPGYHRATTEIAVPLAGVAPPALDQPPHAALGSDVLR
ncbi:hypothetical protein EVAR_323_1 [Eumeta japonica]|uniref:Reverse transcriptase domain-containing protein n=1 Tax=Eumeta variegata TaxID=151549 RepID=A0A4C1SBY7_EUMVA|nr:hypothetical protein EVAR_323_1 [Eumeta japonica]